MCLGRLYWLLDRACWQGDELSVDILLKTGAHPIGLKGYVDFRKGNLCGISAKPLAEGM